MPEADGDNRQEYGSSGSLLPETVPPGPDRQTNVYWLGDTLTALPFDQWKLEISLQTLARRNKTINTTLTVIFSAAIVTRTNS